MTRSAKLFGAALAIGLGLTCAATAQTLHRHVRHPVAETGRQITVYARESYLTLGTGASPGDFNSYVLNTINPVHYMPAIDYTFVGLRGLERLPNNFTVPGCCFP
jgi:hypothetical protein